MSTFFIKGSIVRYRRPYPLLTCLALLSISLSLFGQYPVPANAPASYPVWWFQRGVIRPLNSTNTSPSWPADYPQADDYSVMNEGQLKNLATKANDEFQSQLPSAVLAQSNATALQSLITGWSTSSNADNYVVVNQGQLKALAKQFYDVLGSASYTAGLGVKPHGWTNGPYPWSYSSNADNYSVANTGQAKYLFSFDLTAPTGQTPAWKVAYFSSGQTNGDMTWMQTYSAAVQAEILKNKWDKARADGYVALQSNNPAMLTTGLSIWFKADAGVSNASGNVISWADQAGNSTLTTTGSNAPGFVTNTLNGLPIVRFTGSQVLTSESSADPGLNADMTMVAVVATTNPVASQVSFVLGDDTGRRALGYQAAQQFADVAGVGFPGWSAPPSGTYGIEGCSLSPALNQISLSRNGQPTATGIVTGVAPLGSGITLGGERGSSKGWQGDIAEILVYDHQLSAGEWTQVTAYLSGKYGNFTANDESPVTHTPPSHANPAALGSSPSMMVSMGLNGLADYSSAQQFLDVMKYARVWQTHNAENLTNTYGTSLNGWNTGFGADIPVDANGWPTQVPFIDSKITENQPDTNNHGDLLSSQQIVFTVVSVVIPGNYRVRFRGTGSLHLYGPGEDNSGWTTNLDSNDIAALPVDTNGMHYFDTPAVGLTTNSDGAPTALLTLGIDASSGTNYLHDIEIVTPGYADTNLAVAPFTPAYLATLQGFHTLRMMGWANINNSPLLTWTSRTRPSTYTQSQPAGVALEYMIMICNQLGANLWLNVPDQADQSYMRNAARVILNGAKADGSPFIPGIDDPSLCVWPALNAGLKVYLEYSNETWNYSFPQAANVVARATELRSQGLPFDADNYKAGEQYTAYQSANLWESFYEEWGSAAPQRLVRVMAGMMDTNISDTRLAAFRIPGLITVNQVPDALAVAPYFGGDVANNLVNSGELSSATTADVLQLASNDMATNVIPTMAALKTLADHYGVWLDCYEGGQGLVATGDNVNNSTLTDLLLAANRDPSIGTLYSAYLSGLSSAGVVEITHSADMGTFGKYGSWSVLEYLTQPPGNAPKYQALMSWISTNPASQVNLPPTITVSYPSSVVDGSGTGSVSVPLSAAGSVDYNDTIAGTSWTINGTNYSGVTIAPSLPIGSDTITATVTNSHGVSSSNAVVVTVRPEGGDTVLVQSDFTGTAPGQNIPWTNTSLLCSGITFSGWSYPGVTTVPGVGDIGIGGGLTNNDVFGLRLEGFGGLPVHRVALADAVQDNEYLRCTITPQAGKSLDLRGASIIWSLHSTDSTSAQQCALMTSISGFVLGAQVYQTALFNPTGADETDTFSTYLPFSGAYANVTGPVELRLYLSGNCFSDKPIQLVAFKMLGSLK